VVLGCERFQVQRSKGGSHAISIEAEAVVVLGCERFQVQRSKGGSHAISIEAEAVVVLGSNDFKFSVSGFARSRVQRFGFELLPVQSPLMSLDS
jgi:hypothetical protein